MKQFTTIFIFLFCFSAIYAKQMPSLEQQLQVYQDLRAENYMTEQQFRYKTHHLQSQINQQKITVKGVGTAEISGQILNGGVGISGIQVQLFDADTHGYMESQNAVTGGVYAFTGLGAGNYYVMVTDPFDDYVDAIWSSTGTQFCNFCAVPPESTISIAAGAVSTGHNLNLTVGAVLTGQMSDSVTGDPVETLNVQITKPGDPSFNWYMETIFDGSGNYTVKGLPGGTYRFF